MLEELVGIIFSQCLVSSIVQMEFALFSQGFVCSNGVSSTSQGFLFVQMKFAVFSQGFPVRSNEVCSTFSRMVLKLVFRVFQINRNISSSPD